MIIYIVVLSEFDGVWYNDKLISAHTTERAAQEAIDKIDGKMSLDYRIETVILNKDGE